MSSEGVTFGRYTLHERIAVGGMAEIFRATYRTDANFTKTLVIKRILPQFAQDDQFIEMFRFEASLSVRLAHANIVQVFDFGRYGDSWYLAMEYVHGQSLSALLRRAKGPLPPAFAVYIASEAAKGLAFAHAAKDDFGRELGVIHRDVTPSNLLLSYEGEVKLADFGIAKAASRGGSTRTGVVKGKIGYLSPEQLAEAEVDGRVDVWSLGVAFWEMLTGQRLFKGATDAEILGKIATGGPVPPPSSIKPQPPGVDAIAMKALARNPAERIGSAALSRELQQLTSRMGISSLQCATYLKTIFADKLNETPTDFPSAATAVDLPPSVTQESSGTSTLRPTVATPPKTALEPAPLRGRRRPGPAALLGFALGSVAIGLGLAAARHAFLLPTPTPAPATTIAALPSPSATLAIEIETATSTPAAAPSPRHTGVAHHPTPTPKAVATPTAAPTAVAMNRPVGIGKVSVDSDPPGEIWIDGAKTDRETPAFDFAVPAGHHEIRIVSNVHRLSGTKSFDLAPDQALKLGTVKLSTPF